MYQNTSTKSVTWREKAREEWRAYSFMVCQAHYLLFSNRIKSFKQRVINWKCPENLPRISISFYSSVSPLGLTAECVCKAKLLFRCSWATIELLFLQLLLAYGAVFFLHSLIEWYSERDFHLNSVYYFNSSSLRFAQNFNVPSMVHCLNHFVGVCSNEIEPRSTQWITQTVAPVLNLAQHYF